MMTSSVSNGGPSRFLVTCCCCITLLSVVFYSASFMRLAWELRAQNKRILALEENQKETATDTPLSKPLNQGKSDPSSPIVARLFVAVY